MQSGASRLRTPDFFWTASSWACTATLQRQGIARQPQLLPSMHPGVLPQLALPRRLCLPSRKASSTTGRRQKVCWNMPSSELGLPQLRAAPCMYCRQAWLPPAGGTAR